MPDKNLYFIGIIPPAPIFDQVLELKHYFRDHFQSKASLNSPSHITLHMPFEWKDKKEVELLNSLERLSSSLTPVGLTLKNFGSFPPRTIFIHVDPSPELLELQRRVKQFFKEDLNLFNADYKDLPFHPHLTIAFRDLRKAQFQLAWGEFSDKSFDGNFLVDKLSLMKHDGKKWEVFKDFPMTTANQSGSKATFRQ